MVTKGCHFFLIIFEPHFDKLQGFNRPSNEWVSFSGTLDLSPFSSFKVTHSEPFLCHYRFLHPRMSHEPIIPMKFVIFQNNNTVPSNIVHLNLASGASPENFGNEVELGQYSMISPILRNRGGFRGGARGHVPPPPPKFLKKIRKS